jgi:hypothetical protein
MLQKNIKDERTKDDILSGNDIKKLRQAYQNYSIPLEYLVFDVKSIMENEGLSKVKAVNHIINILDKAS